ncbi:hypothetical protein [Paraburkholderia solisilvae]|uniref:Uncharacterized protein n=1 Tax=Paraburkholderia solisilvae TaxID=624376 RepID=A0A6J5DK54_9BURK|nr:hypothetical protein [Paraburkholderia solisilvae]CAB3754670.1 hypothetical protein LMG29739_01992 [Paraburkholderia solisilvae]
MPTKIKTYSTSLDGQNAYVNEQKARVSAREQAENERAQKRREMDARIDVNASKWRYISLGE